MVRRNKLRVRPCRTVQLGRLQLLQAANRCWLSEVKTKPCLEGAIEPLQFPIDHLSMFALRHTHSNPQGAVYPSKAIESSETSTGRGRSTCPMRDVQRGGAIARRCRARARCVAGRIRECPE